MVWRSAGEMTIQARDENRGELSATGRLVISAEQRFYVFHGMLQ